MEEKFCSQIEGLLPKELNEGEIVSARVVEITSQNVIVDLGLKAEGIIPREEFTHPVSLNEEIFVLLKKKETSAGHPQVSYRLAQLTKTWEKLDQVFRQNSTLEASIGRKVKGGFLVTLKFNPLDIEAFLPAGEIIGNYKEINRLEPGKKIGVKIIELNAQKKNAVVSQKKYIDAFFHNLKEGEIIQGKVKKIVSYGAFINLESVTPLTGMEGLLHISDISWGKVEKVEDFLKIGEEIKVKILKIERSGGQGKISLGLKQLTPYPWENIESKYRIGEIVKGKVTSITKFGVFVKLEPGIEGLAHISELSWTTDFKHPTEIVKTGEALNLRILSIDREKEKISLSLKRTLSSPWEEVKIKYPSGTKINGEVTHLTPFGAFVRLPEGIEGLIHVSDLSWTKRVRHPQEVLQVGMKIETIVLEVIPEKEKIVLGLKQLTPDPYLKYQAGTNVQGKISGINDFGIFLELEPGIEGMIHFSEIFLPKGKNLKETFKIGEPIYAKIIRVNPKERKIALSIKKYEKEKEWQEMSKYLNRKDNIATLGEIVENLKNDR